MQDGNISKIEMRSRSLVVGRIRATNKEWDKKEITLSLYVYTSPSTEENESFRKKIKLLYCNSNEASEKIYFVLVLYQHKSWIVRISMMWCIEILNVYYVKTTYGEVFSRDNIYIYLTFFVLEIGLQKFLKI